MAVRVRWEGRKVGREGSDRACEGDDEEEEDDNCC